MKQKIRSKPDNSPVLCVSVHVVSTVIILIRTICIYVYIQCNIVLNFKFQFLKSKLYSNYVFHFEAILIFSLKPDVYSY